MKPSMVRVYRKISKYDRDHSLIESTKGHGFYVKHVPDFIYLLRISSSCKKVLLLMHHCMYLRDQCCKYSVAHISNLCGLEERTVRNTLATLVKLNLLCCEEQGPCGNAIIRYYRLNYVEVLRMQACQRFKTNIEKLTYIKALTPEQLVPMVKKHMDSRYDIVQFYLAMLPDLSGADLTTLLMVHVLSGYGDKDNSQCIARIETLAEMACLTERVVQKSLARLLKLGFISQTNTTKIGNETRHFIVNYDKCRDVYDGLHPRKRQLQRVPEEFVADHVFRQYELKEAGRERQYRKAEKVAAKEMNEFEADKQSNLQIERNVCLPAIDKTNLANDNVEMSHS